MRHILFCGLALLLALATGCDPDRDFLTGEAVNLRFELDTLSFDTVFTQRGSAVQLFLVYNDATDPIMIDRVAVAGRTGVTFNFNIDGTEGPEARDVVIWGKDSIFVFVTAEVDPTAPENISPFIAEDELIFETGNFQESVVLQAFGQNALYLNGFNRGTFFQPICRDGMFTLPVDLPTVIYGSMVIDSCVVQVLAGSRLYFHGGIQKNTELLAGSGIFEDGFIYTLPNGSLQLLGTAEDPVILSTDRLEEPYRESQGAYRGLIFGPLSKNNRIEYAELNNAIAGITVDSLAEVSIDNTVIAFTSGPALSTYQSDVTVRNSLLHSSSGNSVQVVKGGSLTLEHTTVASYSGSDNVALFLLNDIPQCEDNCDPTPLTVRIRNSILSGFDGSELAFGDVTGGSDPRFFDVRIENSVVRTDENFLNAGLGGYPDFYTTICRDCYNLQFDDPLFVSVRQDSFQLDSLSVARDLSVFLPELPTDLVDYPRDTDTPDAGALEYQPEG
ncbi:hypothetical protein [Neolewinella sp.]|uniref:hypothetical protein n=1 Tax=Neolewinella sp. TaxID=2993543 RepID=UPI003B523B26